ncbi:MAG: hypothetical protein JRN15_06440 [Nitrososphaerota archaeon]|nr:hypothetical protein [Nitrososphaerota archaeon]
MSSRGIGRTALIVVAVVIVIILAVGAYAAMSLGTSSTSSQTTSQTTSSTSQSSATSQTTQTSTTSSSVNYQPITWEMQTKPLSLDPAVPYESWSGMIIENVYEPLLWYNQSNSQTIPWLAQSYNVSADGLSYTFTLRQGITFCDGTPFNASAVKFSIDREIIMDVPSSLVYNFGAGGLAGASQYFASNKTQADVNAYLAADGVTVDGPYTVTFHLVRPSSFFTALLTLWIGDIVSPSFVNAHGGVVPGQANTYMQTHACGTGPFTLASYDPTTGTSILNRSATYWGTPFHTGPAKTPYVIVKVVPDGTTMLTDIQGGAADGVELSPTLLPQVLNITDWLTNHKIVTLSPDVKLIGPYPLASMSFIEFNVKALDSNGNPLPFQPFSDLRVREAMSYAFNASAYIKSSWYNFGYLVNNPIALGEPGYNASFPYYQYNLSAAKQLLLEAGPSVGFSPSNPQSVTMYYISGTTYQQDALLQLANAVNSLNTGLTLNVQGLAGGTFFSYLRTQQAYAWGLGNSMAYPNGYDMMSWEGLYSAGGAAHRANYNNSEVNSLLLQASQTSNQTLENILLSRAALIVHNSHIYLYTVGQDTYQVVGSKVYSTRNAVPLDKAGLAWDFYWTYKLP